MIFFSREESMSIPRYLKCVTTGTRTSKCKLLMAVFKGSKEDLFRFSLCPDIKLKLWKIFKAAGGEDIMSEITNLHTGKSYDEFCVFKWGRGQGGVRHSNMCAQLGFTKEMCLGLHGFDQPDFF